MRSPPATGRGKCGSRRKPTISALLFASLALSQAAPVADPIAAAFADWYVEVEDDAGGGDSRVTGVTTQGCVTTIVGEKGRWTVDWRTVRTIAMEDVFVFLQGPGLKIAVVADVQDAAGQARLRAMRDAMAGRAAKCQAKPL